MRFPWFVEGHINTTNAAHLFRHSQYLNLTLKPGHHAAERPGPEDSTKMNHEPNPDLAGRSPCLLLSAEQQRNASRRQKKGEGGVKNSERAMVFHGARIKLFDAVLPERSASCGIIFA
jgi:hypothetical protein